MKIAYLGIKGLPAKWGADRVVEALAKRLACRHEITVYCSNRCTLPDARVPGVRLVRLPSLAGKRGHMTSVNLMAAWHAVLYGDYDLIHVHNTEAGFVLPILKLKYKVVTTAHGRITSGSKWDPVSAAIMRSMEIPYALLSNVATSVSLPHAEEFSARFHRPIHYIPNGVDGSAAIDTAAARLILERYRIPVKGYILFAAGRIIPLKGLHLLLQAIRGLEQICNLVVVGDLGRASEYVTSVKSIAGEQVTFIPFIASQAELLGLIAQSTLFVFPSLAEAMSMMLLEASSTGVPILCSDLPANKIVLAEHALYFSAGNALDLHQKLDWALGHLDEIQIWGQNARRHVHKEFSWDIVATHYEGLYRELLQGNYAASGLFSKRLHALSYRTVNPKDAPPI